MDRQKPDLPELKKVLSKWQIGLDGVGWNSLYMNNHDQPRMVSDLAMMGKYWKESAKMLAVCLHVTVEPHISIRVKKLE